VNPIPDLIERFKALFFRDRLEREMEEELRHHRALDEESGVTRHENLEQVKEEVRDARGVRPLEELVADTRYALRALRRNAGFTLTVVATLGVGAATAVFIVVNRILLAGLPYPDPERLVRVYQQYSPTNRGTISVVDILAIRDQQRTFDAFGAVRLAGVSIVGAGGPARVGAGRVTSGFFKALGVTARYGRLIEPADDIPGAPRVVVVSYAFAERALGGAAAAVGKVVPIDAVSHTVVGVLEPGRTELAGLPFPIWPVLQLEAPSRRGPFGYRGIGRIAAGVTLGDAERDLAGISERIFPLWASGFQDTQARLRPVPLREAIVGYANGQIGLFAGGVGLVLLLAIANVATLVLVRTSAREHELSVRAALGAGRRRLARLVVTECITLTGLAGITGLGLAVFALKAVGLVAPGLPRLREVSFDAGGVAFAAAATLVAGVLVSVVPLVSLFTGGSSLSATLAGSPARAGSGRRAGALRGALVVSEFALALPLLIGAGLLLNSFLRLQRVEPGFDPTGVYGLAVSLPAGRYAAPADVKTFWRRVEARAAEADGVTAVGLAGSLPPDNFGDVNNFDLLDKPVPAGTSQHLAPWSPVSPGFFAAMGIPLLDGRLLTPGDSPSAPPVVVVSRTWAATYYPNECPIGKQLYSGGCTSCAPTTVVGVVGDVQYRGLGGEADAVYAPVASDSQDVELSLNLVVRSRIGAAATFRALRSALGALDPQVAPVEVVMTERLRDALGDPRRWTAVVGAFAAAGALLAALGIFGLMSYVVRQRRREMGVRLALGAAPGSLTGLVVGRGMRYVGVGTAIGLALSALEARWLGSLLYGVRPADPATTAIAVGLLLLIAVIACWVPGLQAARIKPIEVLASE
jgi:predicted permease